MHVTYRSVMIYAALLHQGQTTDFGDISGDTFVNNHYSAWDRTQNPYVQLTWDLDGDAPTGPRSLGKTMVRRE